MPTAQGKVDRMADLSKLADRNEDAGQRSSRIKGAATDCKAWSGRMLVRVLRFRGIGGGDSDDFGLAELWASTRIVRLTDGPDEVHERQLARMELPKYAEGAAS